MSDDFYILVDDDCTTYYTPQFNTDDEGIDPYYYYLFINEDESEYSDDFI